VEVGGVGLGGEGEGEGGEGGVGEFVEEKHSVADMDWEALPVEVMVADLVTSPVGDTREVLVLVKLEEPED